MKLDQIFREFINVVQENPSYTIGLLNEKGRIISCSKADNVGRMIDLSRSDNGDRLYSIDIKNGKYGYLWVNSSDVNIVMVGNLLFESLKTRITYEINQESARASFSIDDQLIKELINEKKSDYNYILDLMKKIKFDPTIARISIHIVNNNGFNKDEITNLKYKINEKSTVYSLLDKYTLLMFKAIPSKLSEKTLFDYLDEFICELIEWGLTECYFTIGAVQSNPRMYVSSYKNCIWIQKNIEMLKDTPYYFQNYIVNYIVSNVQTDSMDNIFDYYKEKTSNIDIEEMLNIANHLYFNDFNIKQTAESLFLHKNTLLYKIKRYEQIFNIDLRGSFQGKVLFYLLSNYLKENSNGKLVGENYER